VTYDQAISGKFNEQSKQQVLNHLHNFISEKLKWKIHCLELKMIL